MGKPMPALVLSLSFLHGNGPRLAGALRSGCIQNDGILRRPDLFTCSRAHGRYVLQVP